MGTVEVRGLEVFNSKLIVQGKVNSIDYEVSTKIRHFVVNISKLEIIKERICYTCMPYM